jgi:hypothetical protein
VEGISPRAPVPGAPAAERVEAYASLAPLGRADSITTTAQGTVVAQSPEFLVLGDGRRVYRAEDLAPVVEPDSPTAQAGKRVGENRDSALTWANIGAVVGGALIAGSLAGFATPPDPGDPTFEDHLIFTSGTLGTGVVVFLATGLVVAHYGQQVRDDQISAFATYDRDLRKRLDVCTEGLQIVACQTAPTAPSASTPVPASPPPPAPESAAAPR